VNGYVFLFQRRVFVPDIPLFVEFPIRGLTRNLVLKESDLPQFLAQQFVVRVAQQLRHKRVGVKHRHGVGVGVENEDAVFG